MKDTNKTAIHSDVNTPFGRLQFDTKKGTSEIVDPVLPLRQKMTIRKRYQG
jgi:hypothetical protein